MAQNRILISALAALVAAFGFYHFAVGPKRKEAADLQAKIATAQETINTAQAALAANRKAKDGFAAAYARVVDLGKAVPGDDDVRSLVVQLDSSAKRAGVAFKSIDVGTGAAAAVDPSLAAATPLPPGATIGPAGFPIMPFSFRFTGQFFRLSDFFRRLDAYVKASNDNINVTGRLLTVDGMKLEPDAGGFPNISATVQATSYLVSPLEGLTGGATPGGPSATTPTSGPTGAAGTTTTAGVTG